MCTYFCAQGWDVLSGDCFGNLISWDVRTHLCSNQWNLGHNAINDIAIDPAKTLCACATDGQDITLLDPTSHKVSSTSKYNCHSHPVLIP